MALSRTLTVLVLCLTKDMTSIEDIGSSKGILLIFGKETFIVQLCVRYLDQNQDIDDLK